MNKDEIVKIAKELAAENGWTWLEPVEVKLHGDLWTVHTNWPNRGCNIKIEISDSTKQVKFKAFLPR